MDDFKELPKQCFCEPKNNYEPYHCSADGGSCSCKNGNIFYGRKFKEGSTKKLANFEDVTSSTFAVIANSKEDYVPCEPDFFGGVDPLPDEDKQCYCDDQKKISSELIKGNTDYWAGV